MNTARVLSVLAIVLNQPVPFIAFGKFAVVDQKPVAAHQRRLLAYRREQNPLTGLSQI